jgi:tetratricopeptide (TPR) repeat protein
VGDNRPDSGDSSRDDASSSSVSSTAPWPRPAPGEETRSSETPAAREVEILPSGTRLGRYLLKRVIGRGGMGVVYEAWDARQKRPVALKTLSRPETAAEGTALERFLREARAAARLAHPGIVTIFDVAEDGGRHFIVLDLVKGQSLEKCLKEWGSEVGLRRRVEIAEQVAAALGAAHASGVVHRDVKPANILIHEDERALLTDFGLAGEAAEQDLERITVAGVVLGTPRYISPEQAAGGSRKAVPASDVWSLGIVLFRMLTGRLPFAGSAAEAMEASLTKDPPLPSSFNPDVSPELDAIVLMCLEKDPGQRYPDGAALSTDLRRWLDGLSVRARARRPRRRRLSPLAMMAGAVVILAAAAIAVAVGAGVESGDRTESTPETGAAVTLEGPKPLPPTAPFHGDLARARQRAEAIRILDSAYARLAEAERAAQAVDPNPEDILRPAREASRAAQAALQAAPGLGAAHHVLGRACLVMGGMTPALEALREAVRLEPELSEAREDLAIALMERASLAVAEELWVEGPPIPAAATRARAEAASHFDVLDARESVPRDPLRRDLLACLAAWARGDVGAAERLAARGRVAHAADPRSAMFVSVSAFLADGKEREAFLASAAGRAPVDLAAASAWAAILSRTRSSIGRAGTLMETVLLRSPLSGHALGAQALASSWYKRSAEAVAAAQDAVEAEPGLAFAWSAKGTVLETEGKGAEAEEALTKALELDPDHGWSRRTRARVRMGRKAYELALEDAERAKVLRPDDFEVALVQTQALSRLHRFKEAALEAERALTLRPGNPMGLRNRAFVRAYAGEFADAEQDMDAALEIDPNDADAWLQYAELMRDRGKPERSVEAAKKALSLAPEDWMHREFTERLSKGGN